MDFVHPQYDSLKPKNLRGWLGTKPLRHTPKSWPSVMGGKRHFSPIPAQVSSQLSVFVATSADKVREPLSCGLHNQPNQGAIGIYNHFDMGGGSSFCHPKRMVVLLLVSL